MTDERTFVKKLHAQLDTAKFRGVFRGTIGWDQGDGTVLLTSPDARTNEVYVTFNDDPRAPVLALCLKVKRAIGLNVLVERNVDGRWEIQGVDNEPAMLMFGAAAPDAYNPDSADPALDKALRSTFNLMEGRGRALDNNSMFVYINTFLYDGGFFPGGSLDLTSFQPGTANTKAWVVVAVDPSDNTLTAFTGDEFGLAVTMTDAGIADVVVDDGLYPCWAWVLSDSQTVITPQTQNADARLWFMPVGGSGGTFSGDAYDVPYTPADADDWLTPTIADVGAALDERALRHFKLDDSVELTIASDAITIPATGNHFRIDTEANAASDAVETISGGVENKLYFFRAENTARTVQFITTDNVYTPDGQAQALDSTELMLVAVKIGTDFIVLNITSIFWLFEADGGGGIEQITNREQLTFSGSGGILAVASAGTITHSLNINGLTERVIGSGDMLPFYDVASGLPSKVDYDDLEAAILAGVSSPWDETSNVIHPTELTDQVAIGDDVADASAILDVISTSLGSRPIPIMTAAQVAAIASPAEGLMAYATDTDMLHQYDAQRFRNVGNMGWLPYALPDGIHSTVASSSNITLAANGGSIAIPIFLSGHMLLEAVTINQRSTATQRTWGWDIYAQYLNNGNSGENTLARVAASNGDQTFTPSAADNRTLAAASAPVYLGPGLYWLVLQSTHATSTLVILGDAGANLWPGFNKAQTKTTTNANGATLDFVAATWTKITTTAPVVLTGRVFGTTSSF
jgi:hypothetical protein